MREEGKREDTGRGQRREKVGEKGEGGEREREREREEGEWRGESYN